MYLYTICTIVGRTGFLVTSIMIRSLLRNLSYQRMQSHIRCSSSTSYDPFEVLGIGHDSNETTIKNAYIRLAKQFHPDRNPADENAKEKFVKIQNAYRLIMEKVASINEDPGENKTSYSYTASPLAVETHPTPTFQDGVAYKTILIFVGVFLFLIAIGPNLKGKSLPDENDERILMQEEVENLKKYEIIQQQKSRNVKVVGSELNDALLSFKPR